MLNNKGQSLVEVVIGLALAILVLGALINAVITSLYNSNFAKSQAEATKLAQQIMEQVRIKRDTLGYSIFSSTYGSTSDNTGVCYKFTGSDLVSLGGGSCLTAVKQDLGSYAVVSSTKFKHFIQFTKNPSLCTPNCSEIRVSVFWADSNCPRSDSYCHKSEISSYLTLW